jgi:hypothetical protein
MISDGHQSGGLGPTTRHRLEEVRRALLGLHKALLDAERIEYEGEHGRVERSSDFLQLAMHAPSFAWLRPLLALVVTLDEVLASDALPPGASVPDLFDQARAFLKADPEGNAFHRRYAELLQEVPAVVIAHSHAVKALRASAEPS